MNQCGKYEDHKKGNQCIFQCIQFYPHPLQMDSMIKNLRNQATKQSLTLRKKWGQLKMGKVSKFIKLINCQSMLLATNYETKILIQIEDIKLPKLKNLCLWQNRIESIQGICKIWLPNLQQLLLHDNKITVIRSLRRCNFPNITQIVLANNSFCEYGVLNEIDMGQLRALHLNYDKLGFEDKNDDVICQYLPVILKFNMPRVQNIHFLTDSTIFSSKIYQIFGRKIRK